MTFKELYVKEMDEIILGEDFLFSTTELMKQRSKGKDEKALIKNKPIRVLAVAVVMSAVLALTAFAVSYLLSASEVADYLGDKEIAHMFKNSVSKPQTVSNGVYDVVFLGETTGALLDMTEDFEIEETRTYAVIAIKRTDGNPIYSTDDIPIRFAPVIEDCIPVQSWSMLNIGASAMKREGIIYYLFDYSNLEIFADRKPSIALFEGNEFPTLEILSMAEDGKIVYNESYVGIKGFFELPLDESKADPEAADSILGNY